MKIIKIAAQAFIVLLITSGLALGIYVGDAGSILMLGLLGSGGLICLAEWAFRKEPSKQ